MKEKAKKNEITVFNKISHNFRELHVDGAYGGLTPKNLLNINFYAERFPIPKSIIHDLSNRTITDSSDSKVGIIREFEFGIYVDLHVAKQLSEFLLNKISEFEQITKQKTDADSNSK